MLCSSRKAGLKMKSNKPDDKKIIQSSAQSSDPYTHAAFSFNLWEYLSLVGNLLWIVNANTRSLTEMFYTPNIQTRETLTLSWPQTTRSVFQCIYLKPVVTLTSLLVIMTPTTAFAAWSFVLTGYASTVHIFLSLNGFLYFSAWLIHVAA